MSTTHFIKDFTGQKFGLLTFIRQTGGKDKRGGMIWEIHCDCGKIIFSRCNGIASGSKRKTSCGCRTPELRRAGGRKTRKYHPRISSARQVWQDHHYDDGDIDFDTFLELSQQPCYYCKRTPSNTTNVAKQKWKRIIPSQFQLDEGDFTYSGLDRIDCSLPHNKDNVVPCCYECNWSKLDLSIDEFLDHIERMYEGTQELREQRKTLKAVG